MLAQLYSGFQFDSSHGPLLLMGMAAAVLFLGAFGIGIPSFDSGPASRRGRSRAPFNPSYAAASQLGGKSARPLRPGRFWAPKDNSKRRATLRRDSNPVDVFVSLDNGASTSIPAVVLDRSRGGLR